MERMPSSTLRPHHRAKRRARAQIEPLLPRLKEILVDLYGDRLVSVILYGSFARDKATEDSDIDIAVVLRGEVDKSLEHERSFDRIYELGLESNELISVWPMSEMELMESEWPLYYWIRTEGVKL
jgi:predicted nucleotidyltransferase